MRHDCRLTHTCVWEASASLQPEETNPNSINYTNSMCLAIPGGEDTTQPVEGGQAPQGFRVPCGGVRDLLAMASYPAWRGLVWLYLSSKLKLVMGRVWCQRRINHGYTYTCTVPVLTSRFKVRSFNGLSSNVTQPRNKRAFTATPTFFSGFCNGWEVWPGTQAATHPRGPFFTLDSRPKLEGSEAPQPKAFWGSFSAVL
ncbi:hypothetical protein MANI_015499 [Metarhizium anisopliae]|nr:hypothetical protein MANI_015499 [Metarhizium anisopliae]